MFLHIALASARKCRVSVETDEVILGRIRCYPAAFRSWLTELCRFGLASWPSPVWPCQLVFASMRAIEE